MPENDRSIHRPLLKLAERFPLIYAGAVILALAVVTVLVAVNAKRL